MRDDGSWLSAFVECVWSRRKAIFYCVTAVSFASNVVVLADWLHVHASDVTAVVQQRLLALLRDAAEAVAAQSQKRPVLYMLINVIVLYVLLKSGFLSSSVAPKRHFNEGRSMQDTLVSWWSKLSSPALSQLPIHDGELMHNIANHANSATYVIGDSGEPSKHDSVAPNLKVGKQTKARRASLFTIEPLTTQEPPFATTAPYIEQGPAEHSYHEDGIDDYDLNRQEFNARVEGFISKFKKNLSMQRQDSFSRLLSLVRKR